MEGRHLIGVHLAGDARRVLFDQFARALGAQDRTGQDRGKGQQQREGSIHGSGGFGCG